MIDKFSSDAPAYEALEREKKLLREQLLVERRKTTEAEAQRNRLAMDNAQLIRQHNQDKADIQSVRFENLRLRNRCTILEGALARRGTDKDEP